MSNSAVTSRLARLTVEEEERLIGAWREQRDPRAATRLIQAHHGLVRAMAFKYRQFGLALDDLVAEGSVGMFKALERFEPAHGVRLSTYARHWIRAHVSAYVVKNWTLVSTGNPVASSKMFFKVRRERGRALALSGEGSVADEELAERLGTSVARARDLSAKLDARDVSLDAPMGSDAETSLLDRLVCPSELRSELGHPTAKAALHAAVAQLDARERYVIERRWLSDEDELPSLASIGRELGVSRERARQLEQRAKSKLKRRLVVRAHA